MICALLGEGTSDRMLVPILRWVVEQATPAEFRIAWVDTSQFWTGPKLADRVRAALAVQSCNCGPFALRPVGSVVGHARMRLADLVDDWSPLRRLPAFQTLEHDTRAALASLGVPLHPKET